MSFFNFFKKNEKIAIQQIPEKFNPPEIGWTIDKYEHFKKSGLRNEIISFAERDGRIDVTYIIHFHPLSKSKNIIVRVEYDCNIKVFSEKRQNYRINLSYKYIENERQLKEIKANPSLKIYYVPFDTFKQWSKGRNLINRKTISVRSCQQFALDYSVRKLPSEDVSSNKERTRQTKNVSCDKEIFLFELGSEQDQLLLHIYNEIHWDHNWKMNLEKFFEEFKSEWLKNHTHSHHNQDIEDVDKRITDKKVGQTNILLIGPQGSGKTTLINNIANCLQHESLRHAVTNTTTLASNQFWIQNGKRKNISITATKEGVSLNSNQIIASKTCQKFKLPGTTTYLIDTPPVVEAEGVEMKIENVRKIQEYVSKIEETVIICFVMKGNESKIQQELMYTVREVTSRYPPTHYPYLFCFTYSRSTNYKTGDSVPTLKTILHKLKVDLPINEDNTFNVDSEYYRFLITQKTKKVKTDKRHIIGYKESFERSKLEIERMMKYAICKQKELMERHIRSTQRVDDIPC